MIKDVLKVMDAIESMKGNLEERKLGRTEIGKITVSTVYTPDMGYETAILDSNGVYPVERYTSKELASKGHEVWVEKAPTLTEVTQLGYGSLADEETVKLAI